MSNTIFSKIYKQASKKIAENEALEIECRKKIEELHSEIKELESSKTKNANDPQEYVKAKMRIIEIEQYIEYYNSKIEELNTYISYYADPTEEMKAITSEQDKIADKYCKLVIKTINQLEAEAGKLADEIAEGDGVMKQYLRANQYDGNNVFYSNNRYNSAHSILLEAIRRASFYKQTFTN